MWGRHYVFAFKKQKQYFKGEAIQFYTKHSEFVHPFDWSTNLQQKHSDL